MSAASWWPSAMRARGETALEIQFHDGRVPTLVARGRRAEAGPSGPRAAGDAEAPAVSPDGEPPIERLL